MSARRGEVWQVNLDPVMGSEMAKTRPAVVVSGEQASEHYAVVMNDDTIGILPLKIIVPITGWKDKFAKAPWLVEIKPSRSNGLSKPSAADAFQVRSVSEARLVEKIGKLDVEEMRFIGGALILSLELGDFFERK